MIHPARLRSLIKWTLEQMDMCSPAAVELLLGTAAHESHLGRWLQQINGPAKGLYQMEPWVEGDIWTNYLSYRPALVSAIIGLTGLSAADPLHLEFNPVYSTVMARLHYRRIPEPFPLSSDLDGLARYWDQYFNRNPNKGFPGQFVDDYRRLIVG